MIERLAILGVGLIGGSFALAMKKHHLCREVVGFDVSSGALERAAALGVVDHTEDTVAGAIQHADMIMMSVPVLAMRDLLVEIRDVLWGDDASLPQNLVITDAGSVKGSLVKALGELFDPVPDCFVPGHPIAGSELHGVAAANADLFEKHRVILTPLKESSAAAQELLTRSWEGVGAEVVCMDAEHHDQVLAGTSHLPHLLAYALVDTLSTHDDSLEIFKYAAGGFRDFSRIAASDPTMWRDVFKANGPQVIQFLDRYTSLLEELKRAMEADDADYLIQVFKRAKVARDYFSSISEPAISESSTSDEGPDEAM